eukprot:439139-Lingulodinium_polyedra.AAC.1
MDTQACVRRGIVMKYVVSMVSAQGRNQAPRTIGAQVQVLTAVAQALQGQLAEQGAIATGQGQSR